MAIPQGEPLAFVSGTNGQAGTSPVVYLRSHLREDELLKMRVLEVSPTRIQHVQQRPKLIAAEVQVDGSQRLAHAIGVHA